MRKAVQYIAMMLAMWAFTSCYLIMDYDDCETIPQDGRRHIVFSLHMENDNTPLHEQRGATNMRAT